MIKFKQFDRKIQDLAKSVVLELIKNKKYDKKNLYTAQRKIAKINKSQFVPNDQILKAYKQLIINKKIKNNDRILRLLRLKETRSLSGIVVVSILTKPYKCPGKCIYCPTKKGVPKSYLKNEPAVARAILCKFNPYKQINGRLKSLESIGHPIDKINIRIIGGTWSYYPQKYQEWFIKQVFKACNEYQGKKQQNISLAKLQKQNENSTNRIVEISVETRQDFININEIKKLRKYGVTKVELGVQSIYDDVLKFNNRGHNNLITIKATKLLKDAGFKISYQIMPNLPKSSYLKDCKMFQEVFKNSKYKPDYLKIYPLAIIKNTKTYDLYNKGLIQIYDKNQLIKLIKNIKKIVPRYVRIERIIRDIPANEIICGGAKITNLRQIIIDEMKKDRQFCKCIRCRQITNNFKNDRFYLFVNEYKASGGKEFFISYETKNRKKLASILRLRIPSQYFNNKKHFLKILDKCAIIREIHTYGQQVQINKHEKSAIQHLGFGKKMILRAEKIAKENGLKKIAIISGVGARNYFRKQGYKLKNSYMIKSI